VSAAAVVRTLRIRRARAQDVANLAALEAAAFSRPWTENQLAAQRSGGDAAIWLIEEVPYGRASAPLPLAYAIFLRLPGESELLRVATRPEQRGRGLATRLLARALRVLERSGRPRTHLEVACDNATAVALYERLGFFVSGIRKRYYADGSDAVTMTRGPAGNG